MKFSRFLSVLLAGVALASVSCNAPISKTSVTASAGMDKYVTFLDENLTHMPDSLVIATGDDVAAYGADLSEFVDNEGYTIRANDGNVVILGKTEEAVDRAVRQYVKYGNEDNYSFTYGDGYRIKRLTVMGNDISEYAIVRPDLSENYMEFAANELSAYIAKACGVTVSVFTESEYAVAQEKPLRTISLSIDYPSLGDEGFTIDVNADGNVKILGGRYRGCMYGVYDLLRDIGWRFLSDSKGEYIEYLYETEHFDITVELNRTEMPVIANRSFWDGGNMAISSNRNNLRYKLFGNEREYGTVPPATHGLNYIDFNDTWDIQGGFHQPCMTDEDVLQAIEDSVVNQIQTKLDAGQKIGKELTNIDVSQLDSMDFCYCDNCVEIISEEESLGGLYLRMTNRMADIVAERFSPEINVLMLAYSGTTVPPKYERPRDNVKIAFCFYFDTFGTFCSKHCLDGKECGNGKISNTKYAEYFDGWSAICDKSNIQVWYYPLNGAYPGFMSPLYNRIYDDMKYLTDNNIDCLMVCAHDSNGLSNHALPNYLCTLIAWNPDITREEYDAAVREWFDIVYGDSSSYIYEYAMMCEEAGQLTEECWNAQSSHPEEKVSNTYMAESFDYLWHLYRRALSVADTAYNEELVERYMAGMMYICVGITHETGYLNGSESEREIFAERYNKTYELFTKYNLSVYDTLTEASYITVPHDLEKNPLTYWLPIIG